MIIFISKVYALISFLWQTFLSENLLSKYIDESVKVWLARKGIDWQDLDYAEKISYTILHTKEIYASAKEAIYAA